MATQSLRVSRRPLSLESTSPAPSLAFPSAAPFSLAPLPRTFPSPAPLSLALLPDDALLQRLAEILRDSRRLEADLVAHIAEVDRRRLYLREACSSMFAYCVERLHLSEPETALRIVVARASLRHPVLLDMLRDGRLHLSGIALLAPLLTEENREEVLAQASHHSKRQIEELVARLAPRPDAPAVIRRLPQPARGAESPRTAQGTVGPPPTGQTELARAKSEPVPSQPMGDSAQVQHRPDDVAADGGQPADAELAPSPGSFARVPNHSEPQRRSGRVEPLSPARYKVQFTASAGLKEKLERLQVLLRSTVPDGDLATLIEEAVTEKIAQLEAKRLGAAKKPREDVAQSDIRPGPRYIPAAVKRAVRQRDSDRCAYVDRQGRRCTERNQLQFHHRHPLGLGGDRSIANIAQVCRRHNLFEADADFGRHGRAARTKPAARTASLRVLLNSPG